MASGWPPSLPAARARSFRTARLPRCSASATRVAIKIDVTVPQVVRGAGTRESQSICSTTLTATRRHRCQRHPLHDSSPAPFSTSPTSSRAPARARVRPGRDRRVVRPHRDPGHARLATRRDAGAKAVRTVLETHYIGKTPTWSENEEALLAITRPLGIPDPDTNQFVILPDGGPPIRVGLRLARPARRDRGRQPSNGTPAASGLRTTVYRDQRLSAAGWTIIRTTWKQMTRRPHELRPVLVKLLLPAPGSRGAHG